jgi:hypothetical protein
MGVLTTVNRMKSKAFNKGEIAMHRRISLGLSIIFAALAGLALGQNAAAQTTRPIFLTRDIDRGTAQPVNGACTASFAAALGNCVLFTVPAGKRLVVETVSYSVVVLPSQSLVSIVFGLNTVSQYFQVGSPNLYAVSSAPYSNGAAVGYSASQPLRIYLDEGQAFAAGGSISGSNNYEQDFSFSGYLVEK